MSIQLQLETTNTCSYNCVFCPHEKMQRPLGTMSMELYRRIIAEAATIPSIEMVTLTGLGETLQDRFIVERIRHARRTLPAGVKIDMYTAGGLLRPATTDALLDAGLDVLYVSLNATSREKRLEIMRVDDYEKVVPYVQYAVQAFDRAAEARGLVGSPNRPRVIVKGIASKDLMEVGEHEQFQEAWGGDWEKGGAAYLHLEGNWAGSMGQAMRTVPRSACRRALSQIMVLWDGKVVTCCFDAEGERVFGDLNRQTLREIYSDPEAVAFREAHVNGRRSELDLCRTCTAI